MTIQKLLQLLGGAVLALALFFVARHVLRQQELSAEQSFAIEEIEEALAVRQDYSAALRLVAAGLESYPEDSRLHWMRARALDGRGRHGDALEALGRAAELAGDDEAASVLTFYQARSRVMRFPETHDRDDFNLGAGELESSSRGGSHAVEARLLLGMALAEPGRFQDRTKATKLIEEGLADRSGPVEGVDVTQARTVLEQLQER